MFEKVKFIFKKIIIFISSRPLAQMISIIAKWLLVYMLENKHNFYVIHFLSLTVQIRIIPLGAATYFSVQKPFGSSMIGHRSERFCVFLPIFAGRDGEGNEQKLGEEWGQAKQWKFVLKNPSVNGRSHLL